MAQFVLKDSKGKEQIFDHETIYVRDVEGNLMPFTHGTGNPVLEELEVTENGNYTPSEGVDGFGSVKVNVPDIPAVVQPLEVTENGTYTAPDGVDGFSEVTVNVETVSPDVRYVTFKSYDGSVEYGIKAVAVGDDCADPIARGVFGTPTRESDAQYNYTFYGWATEPNGGADADWYKAITEDKTVYANFASAVRYYTITYYDSDGSTVLKTESLAYGATPTYVGEKDGVGFGGWTPELATVTGNASYTAVWVENITFANASWERIAELAESGEASQYFAVGDTKEFSFNGETMTAAIADFNHDDLADGSGKAGMSLVLMTLPSETTLWTDDTAKWKYSVSVLKGTLENWVEYLPDTLKSVIKEVSKPCNSSYSSGSTAKENVACKLWPLSITELGWTGSSTSFMSLGSRYPLFPSVSETDGLPIITHTSSTGATAAYSTWIRQTFQVGVFRPCYLKNNGGKGSVSNVTESKSTTTSYRVRFGFCI